MSRERLKLLTPKTSRLERGAFSAQDVTWEDVAGALSKASPTANLFARICYAGDRSRIRHLEAHLLNKVLHHPETQEMVVKVGTLRALVRLSVVEVAVGRNFPIVDNDAPFDKVRLLKLPNSKAFYRKYSVLSMFLRDQLSRMDEEVGKALRRDIFVPPMV